MKLGKTHRIVSSAFLSGMLFLLGTDAAFSFGKRPETPPPMPTPAPGPTLTVSNPQGGAVYQVGKSVTVSGASSGGISRVALQLDAAVLASAAGGKFQLTATFAASQIGKHTLSVLGLDAAGKALARTDYKVEVRAQVSSLTLENVKEGDSFNEGDNVVFYALGSADITAVEVSRNGNVLGKAEYLADQKKFRFASLLSGVGEYEYRFAGLAGEKEVVAKSVHVNIFPKAPLPQPITKNFNPYILKAVEKIRADYSLLGYNINSVFTHDLSYGGKGTLKATNGALTMCVAAALEVMVTAMDIYAKETGDRSVYDYLPFSSWNSLSSSSIRAQIWVDAKLDSYGSADALAHFGMGELVPFSELQPGSFVNINRENGTGHAVVFISYIDKDAKELDRYDANKVAGFKYFSAQGKQERGLGGFDYRYAFFSKNGCPSIPYRRDCGLMYSTSRKLLNTGMMWHPRDWRKPAGIKAMAAPIEPTAEDLQFTHRPAQFNGLTTDD